MTKQFIARNIFRILIVVCAASAGFAQTTAFNYQGKLSDAGNPANGTYQMEFKLFDAPAGGNQIGATVSVNSVTVNQGIFDAQLDFGAGAFPGADRFLEIAVRRNAGENYVTLSPREQINTTPQAIRSRSAETADNAVQLGGVAASEYPTTASISNTFINNEVSPLTKLGGAPQNASFNISGDGIIGGVVGIGTTAPEAGYKLDVGGRTVLRPGGSGGTIFFGTPNTETGMTITGTNRADLRFDGTIFSFTAGTGPGVPANRGVVVNTSGEVGINSLPEPGLKLNIGGVGRFVTPNGNINLGTPNSELGITFTGSNRADLRFDGTSVRLLAGTGTGVMPNTNGIAITANGNVGVGTVNPTVKFEVAGTMKTNILQIAGGSDLAENFAVADEIKPGMVVAIDPNNAGKLVLARGAYNRQVAGIVSGANNLSAGMILPNLNQSENSMPVALSGRVWVYADATKNPILAGDLLTTSDTPGYAMKVTKYKKANGAIIGKAMTELKSGTGMVLVLVALQ